MREEELDEFEVAHARGGVKRLPPFFGHRRDVGVVIHQQPNECPAALRVLLHSVHG